jgi:hypothetical protein
MSGLYYEVSCFGFSWFGTVDAHTGVKLANAITQCVIHKAISQLHDEAFAYVM